MLAAKLSYYKKPSVAVMLRIENINFLCTNVSLCPSKSSLVLWIASFKISNQNCLTLNLFFCFNLDCESPQLLKGITWCHSPRCKTLKHSTWWAWECEIVWLWHFRAISRLKSENKKCRLCCIHGGKWILTSLLWHLKRRKIRKEIYSVQFQRTARFKFLESF